jgi:hypothetical protein
MKRLTTIIYLSIIMTLAAPGSVAAQNGREQPDSTIDAATRAQVIEAILKRLNDAYVFPEVAQNMEKSIRERMSKKEYDQINSSAAFAEMLTTHLREVSKDKHLGVRYSHEPLPPPSDDRREPSAEERERMRNFGAAINYGFEKVERMGGNVGYLNLRGFFDPEMGGDTVAAAMNFLSNTDALIVDLRQNGGGDPAMVQLISTYLFTGEPVHLNSLYWRPGNRTQEFWTLPYVPGRRYAGKDVYVLTSNRTFSGAEEFAYNLKNLKRATIIGETTGGGAHPGEGVRLSEHFQMFVPTGRAINPISKTNWEGTGVKPDIEVPAAQALNTAYLMALKKAAEKTTDARMKADHQRQIEKVQKELDDMKEKKQPTQ